MVEEALLHGRYKKQQLLGSGSFGAIYKAHDTVTKKDVAIKEEHFYKDYDQLESEVNIYKHLGKQIGFLQTIEYFREGDLRYLSFTLVDQSLESLLNKLGRKMNLKSTLLIAKQLIERIECLHRNGILHRDIKPDNMAMGLEPNEKQLLYIFDLGLSKRFKYNNYHIHDDSGKSLRGTARYASINSHLGLELSRRDDLESIAYVLIYLQKGKLPWQGLVSDEKKSKYNKVLKEKKRISMQALCQGLEPEFAELLRYARNLTFSERPNYLYIRGLFDAVMKRKKYEYDNIYQWTKPTDPAFILKRNTLNKKRRLGEEIKRQKANAQQQKIVKRRRLFMAPSKDDLFFSPYLPLEQRRFIIFQNMLDANFPSLLPPLYPPAKKPKTTQYAAVIDRPFSSTHLVLGCTIDGILINLGNKLPQSLTPDQLDMPCDNVLLDTSLQGLPVIHGNKPDEPNVLIQASGDVPSVEQAVCPADNNQPCESVDLVLGITIDSARKYGGCKLTDKHAEPNKVLVDPVDEAGEAIENKNRIQGTALKGGPIIQDTKPIPVVATAATVAKKPETRKVKAKGKAAVVKPVKNIKAKKRKADEVNLENPEFNKKIRKQEQADLLRIVQEQADLLRIVQEQARIETKQYEQEREKQRLEYTERRKTQYKAENSLDTPSSAAIDGLPPFQQYQQPYQPAVLFKPTFGGYLEALKKPLPPEHETLFLF